MSIPNQIILIFLTLFVLNWYRLHKGEAANKLYDKLDIEPVFVEAYNSAYENVSQHISEEKYLEHAHLFHRDFRYDVVKFMNESLQASKLKTLKKEAKSTNLVSFEFLPSELQENVNEVAEKFVLVLTEACKPKQHDPQKPRRRRRR
ncbi:MAG: hypothetical protein ABJG88_02270 [Litorimonas sp.]